MASIEELELILDGTNGDRLLDVASMPRLRKLHLQIKTPLRISPSLLSSIEKTFPALQELHIRTSDTLLASVTSFLRLAFFPQLSSFHIEVPQYVMGTNQNPEREFPRLIELVSTRCSPMKLAIFKLETFQPNYRQYDTPPVIPVEAFHPILAFGKMRTFTIDVGWRFNFDNTFIQQIAGSWPLLEELSLAPDGDNVIEDSYIGFSAMIHLARGCTKLRRLAGVFSDDVSTELLRTVFREQVKNRSLEALHVGSSSVSNNENMATYLACIFPNLRRIQYEADSNVERKHFPRHGWDVVQSSIPAEAASLRALAAVIRP